MTEDRAIGEQTHAELKELERRLIAMGNMVESLFADSIVALMDRDSGMVSQLRQEDYLAHEHWLELEKLCVQLLSRHRLDSDQVRSIAATMNIAADLKRMADESLRLGEGIRACGPELLPQAAGLEHFPQTVELAQGMLGDLLEAFFTRNSADAAGLHQQFRELTSLNSQAAQEIGASMQQGTMASELGTALLCAAHRLEHIGSEVLDVSNQVRHLYQPHQDQ